MPSFALAANPRVERGRHHPRHQSQTYVASPCDVWRTRWLLKQALRHVEGALPPGQQGDLHCRGRDDPKNHPRLHEASPSEASWWANLGYGDGGGRMELCRI